MAIPVVEYRHHTSGNTNVGMQNAYTKYQSEHILLVLVGDDVTIALFALVQ